MMNIERESNVDTHENWFAYGNFQQWWFHLTPAQRWLLWEKRGGTTTWEPPDLEEEKRRFEASQKALEKAYAASPLSAARTVQLRRGRRDYEIDVDNMEQTLISGSHRTVREIRRHDPLSSPGGNQP